MQKCMGTVVYVKNPRKRNAEHIRIPWKRNTREMRNADTPISKQLRTPDEIIYRHSFYFLIDRRPLTKMIFFGCSASKISI